MKPARLIDLTVAGARYDAMKAALDIMLAAPEFDFVLAAVGSSARAHPGDDGAADHRQRGRRTSRSPPSWCRTRRRRSRCWRQAGVPGFRTPEACADAIAAALSRRAPRMLTVSKLIVLVRQRLPSPREAKRSGGEGSGVGGLSQDPTAPHPGSLRSPTLPTARSARGGRVSCGAVLPAR